MRAGGFGNLGADAGSDARRPATTRGQRPARLSPTATSSTCRRPARAVPARSGTFAISLFNSSPHAGSNLEISALEADGKGKLVSSPRIVTADQTKAMIEQGTEFPYQQATSSGATSVAFRRATLKLEVTPQITPEGNIILDLDINKDSRGETTTAGIAINTKHIKTAGAGRKRRHGGYRRHLRTGGNGERSARFPCWVICRGWATCCTSKSRTSNKQEMLVFITPKMIADRTAAR